MVLIKTSDVRVVILRMYWWLPLLLLLFPNSARGDCTKLGPCSCQNADGVIDLSPLDGHGSPKFKDISPQPPGGYVYSWNPCSPFSELQGCQNVAGCQVSSDGQVSYPIGTQDTAAFATDSTTKAVSVKYSASDPTSGQTRQLAVQLNCDRTDIPGTLTALGEVDKLNYVMSLSSIYCCPGSQPSGGGEGGISVGTIVILVFFGMLLAYIIVGTSYMKFVRKAQGKEVIPNYTLWAAVPGLVKDGGLFTFRSAYSLCGRRQGYDKV